MNYRQAEEYLNSFVNYEQVPGVSYAQPGYSLEHVEELLRRMGNPQLAAKAVHIAGTKGKGSVAAMTARVLSASEFKTGLYTSPHFHTVRERISIDGGLISEAGFADAMSEISAFVEPMRGDTAFRQFTYYEVLTLLGFALFRKEKVGFQVLEVGLGGRLDATNVVKPLVCIITSISLDHTQILGDSLEQIALEKAGIIKPGCWVVVAPQPEEAAAVINKVCRENEAKVVQVGKEVTWRKVGGDLLHQALVIDGREKSYRVNIPLLGDYQLENASAAVAALEILASEGFAISVDDIVEGLAGVKWPGRFQILQREPAVLIDGAHNVASMSRLVGNIREYFGDKRVLVVFGTSSDKDIPGLVNELVSIGPEVIATRSSQPRAAAPSTLVSEFGKRGIEAETSDSIPQALELALSKAGLNDLVCVTGSLFVVAEALDYFSTS